MSCPSLWQSAQSLLRSLDPHYLSLLYYVNHRRHHFLLSKASELASCVLQLEMMRVRFKLWANSAAVRQLKNDKQLSYHAAGGCRQGSYDVMNTVTLRLGSRAITCAQAANCSGSLAMSARCVCNKSLNGMLSN